MYYLCGSASFFILMNLTTFLAITIIKSSYYCCQSIFFMVLKTMINAIQMILQHLIIHIRVLTMATMVSDTS